MNPTLTGPGRRAVLRLWACAWAASAVAGFAALARSDSRPGSPGRPVPSWPGSSRHTPVAAVNLDGPCIGATGEEMERLLARNEGRLGFVFPMIPDASAARGEPLSRWSIDLAATLHVRPFSDVGGVESSRFEAMSSGHAALYDAEGRLRFRGGLTAARGHFGDNPVRASVEAIVRGRVAARNETPVFGCPILDQ